MALSLLCVAFKRFLLTLHCSSIPDFGQSYALTGYSLTLVGLASPRLTAGNVLGGVRGEGDFTQGHL